MIYFVTNRNHNVIDVLNELEIVSEVNGRDLFSILEEPSVTGIDSETTGLDAYTSKVLLISFGSKEIQFVLDATSIDSKWFLNQLNNKTLWLGHNLKFDYSMFKVQLGVELTNLYDTMIVEQRLYANMFDVKTKPFQLDNVIKRNLGYLPVHMNKDIRKEFAGVDAATFVFSNRHITYSAGDIADLFPLRAIQVQRVEKYGMQFLINEIELPLIPIVAEMELEGLDIDQDALRKVVNTAKEVKLQKERELDQIVIKLRDTRAKEKDRQYLTGYKFESKRTEQVSKAAPDLFGDVTIATAKPKPKTGIKVVKPTKNEIAINYGSTPEIIKLFGRLNLPLPNDSGKYVVPILDDKGKVINSYEGFTTQEDELSQFLISNPNSPAKPFIKTLLEYRDASGEISKYGDKFIGKINKVTGRMHYSLRQCAAINGRFQSGGGKAESDKINIQNIKRKKTIRNVFHRKGYAIITNDLTGAEVTVMADKAKDQDLFDLAMKGKIHKIVATTGWTLIYKDRGEKPPPGFEISKEADLEVYTACKNLTFGGVYGCGAKKAAKTINVSVREGQIYLDNERRMFPKTFKMVESNVDLAIKKGYLVLNSRTNSRIWFPAVLAASMERRVLEWDEVHDIDGKARNIPISGTQADMVKEAMVVISRGIKERGWDAAIVIQVHDELVVRTRIEIAEEVGQFVKDTMIDIANKYLSFIKMGCESIVGEAWDK